MTKHIGCACFMCQTNEEYDDAELLQDSLLGRPLYEQELENLIRDIEEV